MLFYSDLNYLKPTKEPILEDLQAIYQSIYTILSTKPRTRVFRPTWGGNLSRYLFEPCDNLTASSMYYDITNALESDPRITLDSSQSYVSPDPVNSCFNIVLKLDIPGFTDYESTLKFKFEQ